MDDKVNPEVVDYWQFRLDSLAQVYDMVELYTQLNFVDCNSPASQINSAPDSIIANSISDTSLTYSLANPAVITFQGHKAFAFDIQLSDSLNTIYFSYANLRLRYDSLTFGTNIYASGKAHIFPSSFFSDTITYGVNPITISDDLTGGPNSLKINTHFNQYTWIVNYHFLPLSTTPVSIARLVIEIENCNVPSIITPYPAPSQLLNHYVLVDSLLPTNQIYNSVHCINPVNFPGCGTRYISSITPDTVNAGVGDTVTINGFGFGNTQGTGNVFLKSANVVNLDVPLDAIDILPNGWSDTLIKFVVPSLLISAYDNPGTGQLSIKNDSGFIITDLYAWLSIHYGVENRYVNPFNKKLFCNLSPINDLSNHAFIFRPDSFFSHYPDRLVCLDNTIKQWVCVTGVNFQLGTDTTFLDMYQKIDSVNTVSFQSMDSSILGLTNTWKDYALGCSTAYIFEIDVAMNKDLLLIFKIDTSRSVDIQAGNWDFFETLLHEFGHACALTHVNDQNALMNAGSRFNGVQAYNRNIKLNYEESASEGGIYVVTHSLMIDTTICPLARMAIGTESHCSNVIGIKEINKPDIALNVFPNPVSTICHIEFEVGKESLVTISIIDFTGRVINESEINVAGFNITEIPIDRLANGYYIVTVRVGNYFYNRKLIKQG